jgi:hypothetical protein
MTAIIPESDVTPATIAAAFDAAAIDYTVEEGGNIYVTTFLFNFWISIDEDRKFLRFYSYWPVAIDTPEDRLYQFVNACNDSMILLQFSVTEDRQRFYGHYMMSYRDGVIRSQVLRMARLFSELFHRAVEHEDTEGLLGVESLDARASIPDAVESGAVH